MCAQYCSHTDHVVHMDTSPVAVLRFARTSRASLLLVLHLDGKHLLIEQGARLRGSQIWSPLDRPGLVEALLELPAAGTPGTFEGLDFFPIDPYRVCGQQLQIV